MFNNFFFIKLIFFFFLLTFRIYFDKRNYPYLYKKRNFKNPTQFMRWKHIFNFISNRTVYSFANANDFAQSIYR